MITILTCDCVRVHPANQQETSWSYRTFGNKTNIIVVILHDSCQHGLPCVIVTIVCCILPSPPMTPAPIVTTHPMAYSWHLSKGHHHSCCDDDISNDDYDNDDEKDPLKHVSSGVDHLMWKVWQGTQTRSWRPNLMKHKYKYTNANSI